MIGFDDTSSDWYGKFYLKFHEFNNIYSVPTFVKPCGATNVETIGWALSHLTKLKEETEFLLPVPGGLANIETTNFSNAVQELWKPYSNLGVSMIMANKAQETIFHVFEDEYEYQLYIDKI